MKLASCLNIRDKVFILDEPTDGLHLQDIQSLIALLDEMVEQGNSIFVIEHSLDVLKAADYVVELGPGGGSEGGCLLFAGSVKKLKNCPTSVTAPYLQD